VMGKALSALFSSEKKNAIDIFLDFEKAVPTTENEKRVHSEVAEYMKESDRILTEISQFKGCDEAIRKAITSPGPETEKTAWDAIVPSVDTLKHFFDFSTSLDQVLPKLLLALFSGTVDQNLSGQQALAKQLADILDFVLRFDDAKMINPAIQNDFSYYRRSLSKHKNKVEVKIKDDLANRMSLFFAYPTPMLRVIIETTVGMVKANTIQKAEVVAGFALMANICLEMVETNKFTNAATNLFCLRAMSAAIVLVDHLDDQGAFHKKTPVHVKNAIAALKTYSGPSGSTDSLLNALRFSTVHLNDADTPQPTKQMLA